MTQDGKLDEAEKEMVAAMVDAMGAFPCSAESRALFVAVAVLSGKIDGLRDAIQPYGDRDLDGNTVVGALWGVSQEEVKIRGYVSTD
jgi:hypothetical protein